jgi:hypothetical protein
MVKHGHRILDGTFGFDALRCPKCDHRMRIISTVTDPVVAKKILAHLDVPTDPLPRAERERPGATPCPRGRVPARTHFARKAARRVPEAAPDRTGRPLTSSWQARTRSR